MRATRAYGQNDQQPQVALKADWGQGVNTVLPADRLPPMQFSHGMNVGLREGYPVTRPGVSKLNWMYRYGVKLGEVFQGGGMIQGSDPDPVTRLPTANLVVVDNDLWLCAPNNEPTLLMEDCTSDLQEVEIIQCFDYVLILRNLNQAPLRYKYEAGHYPEAIPAPREGQTTLPNSRTGVYANNRIWLIKGKNEVIASDIFEWDYNLTEASWQIEDGDNDEVVRLWKVGEDRIVAFKERSVHVLEGTSQLDTASDPPVQIRQYRVAGARGCVAPWAIEQRGQTLFYLSRDGVEALLLSDAGISAMSDKPLSLAMDKYWKTLRWLDVDGARMAIGDAHLLISVPTRYREDESIPSLTLGGEFTEEPPPPDTPPEEEICDDALTFVTYSGSGTWCGFSAFFTYNDGITPRYLTKTIKGFEQYINGEYTQTTFPYWYLTRESFMDDIDALVSGDDVWAVGNMPDQTHPEFREGFNELAAIETGWYGQASYDPDTGCALTNGLHGWRRTNGWQYASLTNYVSGPALTDEIIPDPDDIWTLTLPGTSQVVVGYNTVQTPQPTRRTFRSLGTTQLGNQLGTHTVLGTVREWLGDEHTLFAQLQIDGAVTTTTRASELFSYNDTTGEYSGTLTSFSFDVGLTLNVNGVRYAVDFTVRRTTGATSELVSLTVAYTGDGTSSRTLTIDVPVTVPGTSTEFVGNCITVRRDFSGYIDFSDQDDSAFTPTSDATERWPQIGRFVCGIPSLVGGQPFDDLSDSLTGEVLVGVPGGHCFEDGTFFNPVENIGWHEFDTLPDASLNITPGAIGFGGIGNLFIADNPNGFDGFEQEDDGTYTTMASGAGFTAASEFVEDFQPLGIDDFDAITDDADLDLTPAATGFDDGGAFFIVEAP